MNSKIFLTVLAVSALLFFTGCGEDDPVANITITAVGSDLDGDVTGNGGSRTQTFNWNNPKTTVDYNMDITAAKGGSFNLLIKDSAGATVVNQTLVKGQGDDSKSGVSSAGAAGAWTVTVTLVNFNGDGSFSISPGN